MEDQSGAVNRLKLAMDRAALRAKTELSLTITQTIIPLKDPTRRRILFSLPARRRTPTVTLFTCLVTLSGVTTSKHLGDSYFGSIKRGVAILKERGWLS